MMPRMVGDGLQDVADHGSGEVSADEMVGEGLGLPGVDQIGAPGDVHDRLGQGLVQGDGGLAEAADSALVPRAMRRASPMQMAVSSTVWCTSISVSPVARTVRSMSEWRPSAVSMWS